MAKAFTNPWSPQRSPISQDELGTAFMFFTLQALMELDGLPSRLAVCCTLIPRMAMWKSPGLQFQFQCRGLELSTLPAGRPRVAESFRGSS